MARIMLASLVLVGNLLCVRVTTEVGLLRALQAAHPPPPPPTRIELPTGYDAFHRTVTLTPAARGALIAGTRAETIDRDVETWMRLEPLIRARGLTVLMYCVGDACGPEIRQMARRPRFSILVGAQPHTLRTLQLLGPSAVTVIDPMGTIVTRTSQPPAGNQNSHEVQQWLNAL